MDVNLRVVIKCWECGEPMPVKRQTWEVKKLSNSEQAVLTAEVDVLEIEPNDFTDVHQCVKKL